jgi:hypothetical protein
MSPERKLQQRIVATINKAPLDAWAIPNVVVRKSRRAFCEITGLGAGSPDVYVAIRPGGQHLWLEVKCDETAGTLSEAQVAWHERARSFGVEVVTVRSVEAAVAAVVKARADARSRATLLVQGGAVSLAVKIVDLVRR